jgi:hypothetical protein
VVASPQDETAARPDAAAPQELQFRIQVDQAHCDRAAQGLRAMAMHQYLGLTRRYENIGWYRRTRTGLRVVAPLLGVLVFGFGWVVAALAAVEPRSRVVLYTLAAVLFLEAVALVLAPFYADRVHDGLRARFARFFGDRAARRMRKTRQAAPFEGVYDLRGDLLTYSRIENGQWSMKWHRKLDKLKPRGVALRTPGLLVIFRKPGHVVPAILVLLADDGAMATAIEALGWTITDIDPATGEPTATAVPAST